MNKQNVRKRGVKPHAQDLIQLPILERDPKITEKLCLCRPICKHRRREWKGQIQDTSDELLIDRKPIPECFRRWPLKVAPNSRCPLQGRTKHRIVTKERNTFNEARSVRICQAPVDDHVNTPYLKYVDIVRKLGAWNAVHGTFMFCSCSACCPCNRRVYTPRDAERTAMRRDDMQQFDARVKTECAGMKIMYN